MAPVTIKMSVLLFLYGTRNLVASTLALGGLGMFFAGTISEWWFPIVAGLYAIGWLAVPADKELEIRVRREATQAGLIESLEDLIGEAQGKLPRDAVAHLHKIRETVDVLAPKLASGAIAMTSAVSLTNAVTRDLPETVRNYLRLPSAFAAIHVLEGGKTCKQLLNEQLALLSGQLRKIAEGVYQDDADALVVNGKFLQEKFRPVTFVG